MPIITFDFDEINIDLGLACLPVPAVPATLDIDDDQVLAGVDRATEKCVNGPRVTNMIHRLVSERARAEIELPTGWFVIVRSWTCLAQ